jgi:S-disulfanyl-L-cysteine oxidoreductase SoxD
MIRSMIRCVTWLSRFAIVALAGAAVLQVGGAGALEARSSIARSGAFSRAQAQRGDALYGRYCAQCHLPDMSGKDPAPELAGDKFLAKWTGHSLGELYGRIAATMPADRPGQLAPADYLDLVALLLSANGFAAGDRDLSGEPETLDKIIIPK